MEKKDLNKFRKCMNLYSDVALLIYTVLNFIEFSLLHRFYLLYFIDRFKKGITYKIFQYELKNKDKTSRSLQNRSFKMRVCRI
jgi:hypothetical protein